MLVLHSAAAISVFGLHPAALSRAEMNPLTCCQMMGWVISFKLLKAVFCSQLGEVTSLIDLSISLFFFFFKLAESPVCVESLEYCECRQ